jgi:hypothetical protein
MCNIFYHNVDLCFTSHHLKVNENIDMSKIIKLPAPSETKIDVLK